MRKTVLFMLLIFAIKAKAATYVWNGGSSGTWNTPSNWNLNNGNTPGSADSVVFNTATTVTCNFTTGLTIGKLVINADVIFTINGTPSTTTTLNVGSASFTSGPHFIVNSGKTLAFQSSVNAGGIIINLANTSGSVYTANIFGNIIFANGGGGTLQVHKLLAGTPGITAPNTILFKNGSSFTMSTAYATAGGSAPTSSTNTTGIVNGIVFESGTTFNVLGSPNANPFGTVGSGPFVQFQSGCTFNYLIDANIPYVSRSLPTLVLNNASAVRTLSGNANTTTFDSIRVVAGSWQFTTGSGVANINVAKGISVASGATLIIGNNSGSNSGSLNLNFNGTTQSINNSGNFSVRSVSSNGAYRTNVNIQSGSTLTLNSDFDLGSDTKNTLTVNNGGALVVAAGKTFTPNAAAVTINSTGSLTFKSSAVGTAVLGPVNGSLSTNANVRIERYIPKGLRAFRDLAPGLTPSQTVFNSWQEGGAFTAGLGTYITGIAATKTFTEAKAAIGFVDATAGLDLTAKGAKSMFTYNSSNGTWDSVLNTKTLTLEALKGYRLLVRGDRNWSMYLVPQAANMINATTLRVTGTLLTGTQNAFTLNASTSGATNNRLGFSLVANPYWAPINWNTIATRNTTLYTNYWILSPKNGKYVTYSSAGGTLNGTGTNLGQYIQPGQAFFVRTSSGTPALSIIESDKGTAANAADVFGTTSSNTLRIGLYKPVDAIVNEMVDEAAVVFNASFSNKLDRNDAHKMENDEDNLFIINASDNLTVDARSAASINDVLPVGLSKLSNGTNYQLKVNASGYNSNGFDVYVKDSYKKTETLVKAGGESVVDFTIDNAVSASFNNRFSLVFKPSVLPISSIDVQGVQQGSDVVLSINTVGESNISNYSVEKSTDGVAYSKIATVSAKNTATASYSVTDSKAVSGNNYYRVKVNGLNEASTYSKVVVVKVGGSAAKYALYPNPSNGSQVGVQLTGVSAGKYTVTLRNMLGQEVHRAVVAHVGGNGQLSIKLASKLSSGSYTVSVLGATSTPLYQGKLVVE
jgi:hypothetical protein